MLNLQSFASGNKTMEECLNEDGLSAPIMSKYADQGLRNIRFLMMMGWLNEEEAQTVLQRIIARIGAELDR